MPGTIRPVRQISSICARCHVLPIGRFRGHPHPAGTGHHGTSGRQPGSPCHAQTATHHQHIAGRSLVGIDIPRRHQQRSQRAIEQHTGHVAYGRVIRTRHITTGRSSRYTSAGRTGRCTTTRRRSFTDANQLRFQRPVRQWCHPDPTCGPQPQPRVQPRLVGDHRHRLAGHQHRRIVITHRRTAVGIQPAGDIDGQHRHAALVDLPHQRGQRPAHGPVQTDTEQSVDEQGRRSRCLPGRIQSTRHALSRQRIRPHGLAPGPLGRRVIARGIMAGHPLVITCLMSVRHDRRIAVGPEPRQQLCQRMNDLSVITPGLPCGAGIGSRRWRLLQPRHPHGPNIQPGAPENPARHQRIAAVVARPHQQDHRRLRRHVLPHGQCHLRHGRPGRGHQLAGTGFFQPVRLKPPDGGQAQQGGRQGPQAGVNGRGDRMQFHDSDARETPENTPAEKPAGAFPSS